MNATCIKAGRRLRSESRLAAGNRQVFAPTTNGKTVHCLLSMKGTTDIRFPKRRLAHVPLKDWTPTQSEPPLRDAPRVSHAANAFEVPYRFDFDSILVDSEFADGLADLFGGQDVVFVGVEDFEDRKMFFRDFTLFEFAVVVSLAIEVSNGF